MDQLAMRCLEQFRKVETLFDEDIEELSLHMTGELFEAYETEVEREKECLKKAKERLISYTTQQV